MEQSKRGRGRPPKQIESLPEGLIPLDELEALDVSDPKIEQMAKDFISGKQVTAIGTGKDVRKVLEDKVIGRIGKKGKFLTDKLFEHINGYWVATRIDDDGEVKNVRAYKKEPSLQALVYALNRVLGAPVTKEVKTSVSFSLSALLKPGEGIPNGKYRENNTG
jgi:hypothetical protein